MGPHLRRVHGRAPHSMLQRLCSVPAATLLVAKGKGSDREGCRLVSKSAPHSSRWTHRRVQCQTDPSGLHAALHPTGRSQHPSLSSMSHAARPPSLPRHVASVRWKKLCVPAVMVMMSAEMGHATHLFSVQQGCVHWAQVHVAVAPRMCTGFPAGRRARPGPAEPPARCQHMSRHQIHCSSYSYHS
jgi:hypothetical protein